MFPKQHSPKMSVVPRIPRKTTGELRIWIKLPYRTVYYVIAMGTELHITSAQMLILYRYICLMSRALQWQVSATGQTVTCAPHVIRHTVQEKQWGAFMKKRSNQQITNDSQIQKWRYPGGKLRESGPGSLSDVRPIKWWPPSLISVILFQMQTWPFCL